MATRSKAPTENRAKIIRAARVCFSRQGYHHSTMDDIVVESELSKGTLYWYFKSKEELLVSVISSLLEDHINEGTFARLEHYPTASAKLRALNQSMMAHNEQLEGFFNLFVEFWASNSHNENISHLWLKPLLQYKSIIVNIIEQGIDTGEFRPVDVESLAWSFMDVYDDLATYMMLKPDMNQISEVHLTTLLRGLEADT